MLNCTQALAIKYLDTQVKTHVTLKRTTTKNNVMDLNNFEFQTNKRFHGGYLLTRKAERPGILSWLFDN